MIDNIMKFHTIFIILAVTSMASISSCVPLAIGATAGYVAHEEGYRVQNPIKKSEE